MSRLLHIATIAIACLLWASPLAADSLRANPSHPNPLPRTVLVLDQSIPYTEYFGKLVNLAKSADTERPEVREAKAFLAQR